MNITKILIKIQKDTALPTNYAIIGETQHCWQMICLSYCYFRSFSKILIQKKEIMQNTARVAC